MAVTSMITKTQKYNVEGECNRKKKKWELMAVMTKVWKPLLYQNCWKPGQSSKFKPVTSSFWQELLEVKPRSNNTKFYIHAILMHDLLALPHLSVSVEQMFSKIDIIKNKHSNRLLTNNVAH